MARSLGMAYPVYYVPAWPIYSTAVMAFSGMTSTTPLSLAALTSVFMFDSSPVVFASSIFVPIGLCSPSKDRVSLSRETSSEMS